MEKNQNKKILATFGIIFAVAVCLAGLGMYQIKSGLIKAGYWQKISGFFKSEEKNSIDENKSGFLELLKRENDLISDYEEMVVKAVEKSSPAVVSIIISKNVPVLEKYYSDPFSGLPPEIQGLLDPYFNFQIPQYRQKGTENKEVGGGTGFIVSESGLILTNKHVVSDTKATYTVFLKDGRKFSAKILARDKVDDLALIKIEANNLPILTLADSDNIKPGQTAIAIGNALAEFRNTVSVGVVSGLSRSIVAGDASSGASEKIDDLIQTDAAINPGNSGGPLLNLKGEVIGINTAMAEAQSIGFAIPANRAKRAIESYKSLGRIASPYLGVRYVAINGRIKEANNLSVDYGVWLKDSENQSAIIKNSPAMKAGLKSGDIILEADNKKIDSDKTLTSIIQSKKPGDKLVLKILRDKQEIFLEAVLEERPDNL